MAQEPGRLRLSTISLAVTVFSVKSISTLSFLPRHLFLRIFQEVRIFQLALLPSLLSYPTHKTIKAIRKTRKGLDYL